MSKTNFIQVFEHHKLRYDDNPLFKKHHFDAMVLFNEKNQNKYYTIVHKGILFNSYVGVIQIGGLTIEILPKADRNDSPDKNNWQNVLLNMLRVCKHIKIDTVSETNLKKRHNSILDVYFEMYLDEIDRLVKRGLIKKYRRLQNNQFALKGKLIFSQNIQKNIVHKERFYCEHQVYDKDHLTHHILYKGLLILKGLLNNELKDKLNRLLFEFHNYKELDINKSHFDKISLNNKALHYERALDICKMIILNYSPNLNSGNDNMLTLLFDMNKLWEEYIYRILQRHKPEGYKVSFQNSDKFWEHKTIRPDIVITNEFDDKFVIDTKWKIVDSKNPSDDDLKQMFTYNLHWNAQRSILLYPKTNQEDSKFGDYWYNVKTFKEEKLININSQCKLGFVSLVQEGKVFASSAISKGIFEKLH